ncbi:hypothetical protein Hanom_Chr00s000003g01604291 [Helianthus anomalus]
MNRIQNTNLYGKDGGEFFNLRVILGMRYINFSTTTQAIPPPPPGMFCIIF